jgi:hypothetical protein
MIRKGQMHGVAKGAITGQATFIGRLFGVAASAEQEGGPSRSLPSRLIFLQHNLPLQGREFLTHLITPLEPCR